MKTKGILLGVIAVIMIFFGFLLYQGIERSAAYYYTLTELTEPGVTGKQLRVKADLLKESVVYTADLPRLTFTVSDGEQQLKMVYNEAMPDNFDHISEVIVEGKLDAAGVFQVSKLMLQCPSKYENQSEDSKGGE